MASKINPALLQKLMAKLGVSNKRIYALIQEKADDAHVSSHVASLLVAREHGVGFQRYIKDGDREEMRGAAPARAPAAPIVSAQPARATPRAHAPAKPVKTTRNNTIFVVHGRDTKLNEDIFAFLRAIGINAREFSQAVADARGANPNITQIVKNVMKQAQGVLVMFSPDEGAKIKAKFATKQEKKNGIKVEPQSRPNVMFEAGLALGAHPEKTLIVQVGEVRKLSDIDGMHILHLSGSSTSRKELAQRLKTKLKFKVETTGTSWLTEGNFDR